MLGIFLAGKSESAGGKENRRFGGYEKGILRVAYALTLSDPPDDPAAVDVPVLALDMNPGSSVCRVV